MTTHEHTDQPMRHRMVVFGHNAMFMSHLPMFSMHEHANQVILETELTADDGTDPMRVYRDDRLQHPDVAFYTFDPGRFVLPDILPADGQPATSTTFTGDLYRHHVEHSDPPPVMIAKNVTVNISNVVHGRRFDPHAPASAQLDYIAFGGDGEVYLAHLLTRPPDFDQLIQVTLTPAPAADELHRGPVVTVAGRRDMSGERLEPGQQAQAGSATVDVVAQVYFNEDSDMTDPPGHH